MHPGRHRRWRSGSPAAGWSPAAASRGRPSTSRRGRCCSASSAAGSTTSSPRPAPYLGAGGHPVDALKIWKGGLGIWGAIALGALGAWIGCRRAGHQLPGLRRRGRPRRRRSPRRSAGSATGSTTSSTAARRPCRGAWRSTSGTRRRAAPSSTAAGKPSLLGIFQPTFLYESIFLVVLGTSGCSSSTSGARSPRASCSGSTWRGYPVGRIVIEKLRTDEAELILGQRLNVWTSIVVFLWASGSSGTPGRRRRRDARMSSRSRRTAPPA